MYGQALKAVATEVADHLDKLAVECVAELERRLPAYAEGAVPGDELLLAARSVIAVMLSMFTEDSVPEGVYNLVDDLAQRRARAGFPLDTVQAALRIDFLVVWRAMLEQARTDEVIDPEFHDGVLAAWEIIDEIINRVTTTFHRIEAEETQRRHESANRLVDYLVEGDPARPDRSLQSANTLGFDPASRFLVIWVEFGGSSSGQIELAERALATDNVTNVWRRWPTHALGLIQPRKDPERPLAIVRKYLDDARVGISPLVLGNVHLPKAARLAHAALRGVPFNKCGMYLLDDRLLAVIANSDDDVAGRIRDVMLSPVLALQPPLSARLMETLSAYTRVSSVDAVADSLYKHRNSVFRDLRKIEQVTNRSLRDPGDLTLFKIAIEYQLAVAASEAEGPST